LLVQRSTEPLENWRSGETRQSCSLQLEGKLTSTPRQTPTLIYNMITYSYYICVDSVNFNQFNWGEVLDKNSYCRYCLLLSLLLWRKSFFLALSLRWNSHKCDLPLFSCSSYCVSLSLSSLSITKVNKIT
jgi:hypothetical protein